MQELWNEANKRIVLVNGRKRPCMPVFNKAIPVFRLRWSTQVKSIPFGEQTHTNTLVGRNNDGIGFRNFVSYRTVPRNACEWLEIAELFEGHYR